MGQSLVQLYVHIVFSTKIRKPDLKGLELQEKLHAYLAGICERQNCPAVKIGGVEDHVHLLVRLGKTIEISTLVRELKRGSSTWLKSNIDNFHWQSGYGAFSVSPSHVDQLVTYIGNQEEHHKTVSFQDEFRRLCSKYCVELDERYVWD